ncbi:MAG: DUF1513 domain-containing protein [Rhodospirillales bacterium]|nr:DUF1513 domain-containing protein [Rhodospirillales bacterium]
MPGRRRFLQATAATAVVGLAPRTIRAAAPRAVFLGARVDGGRAFAAGFDAEGGAAFDIALPARGHGFAQRPGRLDEIVAFARRPGAFMIVADRRDGHVLREVAAVENRRFCGHGAFDGTGRLLYATELVHDTGDGILGIYDAAAGYARVGEVPSGGLDPHEIRLLPDGETLVVANGGILTDPDAPGIKLNVDEMESSLAYLRARDGALLGTARLPGELFQLSLRHLAIAPDGAVAVVMQYEGPSDDRVPLLALHRRPGAALETVVLPDRVLGRLRNYCGSAALDTSGRFLATSSPVGGVAVLWDVRERRCLGCAEIADGCGLAAGDGAGTFLVTSGQGGGYFVVADLPMVRSSPIPSAFLDSGRWDNHVTRLL